MRDHHSLMTQLVSLLPQPRAVTASLLGVSESTLRGWLRAGSGETLPPQSPGRAPPTAEQLRAARTALRLHARDVAAALDASADLSDNT